MNAYHSQSRMSAAVTLSRWVYTAAIAWFCFQAPTSDGKPAYVERIPNGNKFQCANCHTTAPNLNSFGRWFDDREQLWDDLVATVDSDGDGATNGEELLDPNGMWRQGDTNPGSIANVTNPGDPLSKPAAPTATQTPTGTRVATVTPTPSRIPTITPTPSKTPVPTNTRKPTSTPKPTKTPTSTKTPTFTQTPTATITPTATTIPPRQVVIVGDAGTSGDTIHIIVAIDNMLGLAGGNITLRYNDEILTPGTPELGELLTSHIDANAVAPINAAKSSGSYLSMAFASFDAVQSKGPGTIFSIPFKISSKAPTGATVIDVFQLQLFDDSPKALSLESVPSSTIWVNSGTAIDEWQLLDGNR